MFSKLEYMVLTQQTKNPLPNVSMDLVHLGCLVIIPTKISKNYYTLETYSNSKKIMKSYLNFLKKMNNSPWLSSSYSSPILFNDIPFQFFDVISLASIP